MVMLTRDGNSEGMNGIQVVKVLIWNDRYKVKVRVTNGMVRVLRGIMAVL